MNYSDLMNANGKSRRNNGFYDIKSKTHKAKVSRSNKITNKRTNMYEQRNLRGTMMPVSTYNIPPEKIDDFLKACHKKKAEILADAENNTEGYIPEDGD